MKKTRSTLHRIAAGRGGRPVQRGRRRAEPQAVPASSAPPRGRKAAKEGHHHQHRVAGLQRQWGCGPPPMPRARTARTPPPGSGYRRAARRSPANRSRLEQDWQQGAVGQPSTATTATDCPQSRESSAETKARGRVERPEVPEQVDLIDEDRRRQQDAEHADGAQVEHERRLCPRGRRRKARRPGRSRRRTRSAGCDGSPGAGRFPAQTAWPDQRRRTERAIARRSRRDRPGLGTALDVDEGNRPRLDASRPWRCPWRGSRSQHGCERSKNTAIRTPMAPQRMYDKPLVARSPRG